LERFGPEAIRMTRTHAKFGLIGAGDWRISIRTSMNLNPNPRCEQFELDDDAAIYRFFEEYVSELMVAVPAGLDTMTDPRDRSVPVGGFAAEYMTDDKEESEVPREL
jgi:hypothetical protein